MPSTIKALSPAPRRAAARALEAGLLDVARFQYAGPKGPRSKSEVHLCEQGHREWRRLTSTPMPFLESDCGRCIDIVVEDMRSGGYSLVNYFLRAVELVFRMSRVDLDEVRATKPGAIADRLTEARTRLRELHREVCRTEAAMSSELVEPARQMINRLHEQIARFEGGSEQLLADVAAAWHAKGVTTLDETPVLVVGVDPHRPELAVSLANAFAVAHRVHWLPAYAAQVLVHAAYATGAQFTAVQVVPCPTRDAAVMVASMMNTVITDAASCVPPAVDALRAEQR